MSILTRFFMSAPLTRTNISKPATIIDLVTPNLFTHLKDSSHEFIKGILDKDIEYIKNITASELGKRLESEMEQMSQSELNQLSNANDHNVDVCSSFTVQPYVVFGDNFKERMQRKNINEGVYAPLSNKYFRYNSSIGLMGMWKEYKQKQIYGFNCFYMPESKAGQEKGKIHEYLVTFETDSQNIDFCIVDCQGALLEENAKKINFGK